MQLLTAFLPLQFLLNSIVPCLFCFVMAEFYSYFQTMRLFPSSLPTIKA